MEFYATVNSQVACWAVVCIIGVGGCGSFFPPPLVCEGRLSWFLVPDFIGILYNLM